MKQQDIKVLLIEKAKKQYEAMGSFKDSNNPQVIALYNQARGAYDAIDDVYYSLFKNYINLD